MIRIKRSISGILIIIISLFVFSKVYAGQGCCSWHGGQAYCDTTTGRWICNDGTYSPSCRCQQIFNYGCTNPNALNYDINANKDDGSCILKVYGCTDTSAKNYNKSANVADGSCLYEKIEEYEEEIKYTTVKINGNENKLQQVGKSGKRKIRKKITSNESNQIISTEILSTEILKEPITEIIMVTITENNKIIKDTKKQDILFKLILSSIIISILYLIYKKILKK